VVRRLALMQLQLESHHAGGEQQFEQQPSGQQQFKQREQQQWCAIVLSTLLMSRLLWQSKAGLIVGYRHCCTWDDAVARAVLAASWLLHSVCMLREQCCCIHPQRHVSST
jgi:hypothetical protein